ncbi:MAG TPA: hypothetical protein VLL25_13000, partial [Acidimicrobiales bacterium]|nr:hypothetical protein [Acidimicrobiales bacterium]
VNDAHTVDSDIFSPCALGGACNEKTIAGMRCRAIVGSANNQLATPDDALHLADRGILYAPDFVVNAGGVINIAEELVGYHRERAYANICRIADTTKRVLATAQRQRITPTAAAEALAHRRIADVGGAAGRTRSFHPPARRPGRHPD